MLDAEFRIRPHKGDQDELNTHIVSKGTPVWSQRKNSHHLGMWLLGGELV